MAKYAQNLGSPQSLHQHYVHSPIPPQQRRHASKQRFVADLSQCLFDFVIQLLPTAEEMSVKEDVRKLLERLIRTLEPNSRLLSFGSTANGFSLRNSGESSPSGRIDYGLNNPEYRYGLVLLDRLRQTAVGDRPCEYAKRIA
jgi:hypothetical protein